MDLLGGKAVLLPTHTVLPRHREKEWRFESILLPSGLLPLFCLVCSCPVVLAEASGTLPGSPTLPLLPTEAPAQPRKLDNHIPSVPLPSPPLTFEVCLSFGHFLLQLQVPGS